MKTILGILALAGAAGVPLAASAQQSSSAQQTSLETAGTATRSMFFTDVYKLTVSDPDGKLVQSDLDDAGQPIRVEVDVLYDGDVPDMPKGWSEEIMPPLSEENEKAVKSAYQSLSKGDTITLDYVPDRSSKLTKNGTLIVEYPDFGLTKQMLDVWFGETPVSEDIKDEILQG